MKKMVKVLIAFGEPISYGGQESFVFKTIESMNRKDLHFDFLTPYFIDNSHYKNFIDSLNSKLYMFDLPFRIGKSRFNVIKKYNELLKKNRYDVVHINSGSISILAIFTLFAKLNHVNKVIVHSHMSGGGKNIKHETIKKLYSFIFKNYADILLAPSYEAVKWQFPNKVFSKKGKIIKNGIETNKYIFNDKIRGEYRRKLDFSSNDIVLGTVGRLAPEKNQVFLIELMKYLVRENKHYKLLLVGDGPERKNLITLVKKYSLANNIKFIGNVTNVEDYLQAMDIFMFPSKYEGLGIASIEAQAAGLPVLASSAVPKDIKLTPNVYFLNLNLSLGKWIEEIQKIEIKKINRKSQNKYINQNGYNIQETAKKLRNIYITR